MNLVTSLKSLTYRQINLTFFVLSALGMVYALYLQHVQNLMPCPLCIFQRVGLIGFGAFTLIAALINPTKSLLKRALMVPALISIGWALLVAGRHVWLQHLPADQVPACGTGLEYLLETFPLSTVIQTVFTGSGECALIDYTLFGFSIPEMSLVFFLILFVAALWLMIKRYPTPFRRL